MEEARAAKAEEAWIDKKLCLVRAGICLDK